MLQNKKGICPKTYPQVVTFRVAEYNWFTITIRDSAVKNRYHTGYCTMRHLQ